MDFQQVISILLISSVFLTAIFIGVIVLVLHIKKWAIEENENRKKELSELRSLFLNEIKKVIENSRDLIKELKK